MQSIAIVAGGLSKRSTWILDGPAQRLHVPRWIGSWLMPRSIGSTRYGCTSWTGLGGPEPLPIPGSARFVRRAVLGLRAARAKGKTIGRLRRVFRRDEAQRLRSQGWSWRKIAAELGVPVMTVRDACTESASTSDAIRDGNGTTSLASIEGTDTGPLPYAGKVRV